MGRLWGFALVFLVLSGGQAFASDFRSTVGGERINSRYCSFIIEPGIDVKKLNRKVKTRGIRSRTKIRRGSSPSSQLGAKCDILFRRAQEILDMYPPGIHITLKVVKKQSQVSEAHRQRFGRGTSAIAVYFFKTNTIYLVGKKISSSVLAHEMAHGIIDHYFGVRPPRKVEELLAKHVDAELREY